MKQIKTDLLLNLLKADSADYKNLETKEYTTPQKKQVIRSLMNIRMPGGLSGALLSAQDDYLRQEREEKGVVTLAEIPTLREQFGEQTTLADKLSLWKGDITRLQAGTLADARLFYPVPQMY